MAKVQSKQIEKRLASLIGVNGFTYPAAATADVTTAITTAATTAGDGATAVPVQIATATAGGFVTTGSNRVPVVANATKGPIAFDDSGVDREVFGKLTEAGGVYSVTLHYIDGAGAEQAYTPAAPVSIDMLVPYRFEFDQLPTDAITKIKARVADDIQGGGQTLKVEHVAITGANTLAALSQAHDGIGPFQLFINGQMVRTVGTNPGATIAGTAITFNAANAGYAIATTDEAIAVWSV